MKRLQSIKTKIAIETTPILRIGIASSMVAFCFGVFVIFFS